MRTPPMTLGFPFLGGAPSYTALRASLLPNQHTLMRPSPHPIATRPTDSDGVRDVGGGEGARAAHGVGVAWETALLTGPL
jgi:hypothetical protein